MVEAELVLEVVPLPDAVGPGRRGRLPVLGVHRLDPGTAEGRVAREPVHLTPALVDVRQVAVQVGEVDADRRRGRQQPELLLALTQRGLGRLELGDVGDDPLGDADAVLADVPAPAVEDVELRAVGPHQPVLRGAALTAGLRVRDGVVRGPVVRVDALAPDVLLPPLVLDVAEEREGADVLDERRGRAVGPVLPHVDVVVDACEDPREQLGRQFHAHVETSASAAGRCSPHVRARTGTRRALLP